MVCKNCGHEALRGMKHCPECGAKLELPASTGPRTEEFRASSLSLDVLYADFKVSFNNRGIVTVKIEGDEEIKEAVNLSLARESLSMEGKLPDVEIDPDSVSISILDDGTVIIDRKRLDKKRKLSIALSLPRNFELEVGRYALGSMTFTTDAGDVILHNSGHMLIQAKSFNNLEAHVSGMADLEIEDVAHGLTADVSGEGDMSARSVRGSVTVNVSGEGDLEITRVEGPMTADINGDGDLKIEDVILTSGQFTITGGGDVDIEDGEIQTLTVVSTGMGGFVFEGHVGTGSFTSSGMGDIEVDSCDNVLRRRTSGMGDIEIG